MGSVLIFPPEKPLHASVRIKGSKSISNRLLILNEIFGAGLKIQNLSTSEDTQVLQDALAQIRNKNHSIINVHHAGTDFRFLTALLSIRHGDWVLDGSERMRQRPVKGLVDALTQLGASITYLGETGYPPLRIQGKTLKGGQVSLDAGQSSQFVSALLLISPVLKEGLSIQLSSALVSKPYLEMTLSLLEKFGMHVEFQFPNIKVQAMPEVHILPEEFAVESDWSSASYFYSLCALSKHSKFSLNWFEYPSLQADARISLLFEQLGVHTVYKNGVLHLEQIIKPTSFFAYDFTDCPDIALTVACTCFGLGIPARLSGLKTLQLKESRRVDVLRTELEKLGARVIADDESLSLETHSGSKPEPLQTVCTYQDHRMAMSFAPLSLVYPGLEIQDPEVVNKSYPEFWSDLQSLGFRLNLQS